MSEIIWILGLQLAFGVVCFFAGRTYEEWCAHARQSSTKLSEEALCAMGRHTYRPLFEDEVCRVCMEHSPASAAKYDGGGAG